jgi:hypothetical protein
MGSRLALLLGYAKEKLRPRVTGDVEQPSRFAASVGYQDIRYVRRPLSHPPYRSIPVTFRRKITCVRLRCYVGVNERMAIPNVACPAPFPWIGQWHCACLSLSQRQRIQVETCWRGGGVPIPNRS